MNSHSGAASFCFVVSYFLLAGIESECTISEYDDLLQEGLGLGLGLGLVFGWQE
jgi:hypothetical protein